jgi:glutamate racemase
MRESGPRVLIFDSGLGGLTVLAAIARERPDAEFIYAADDARFPYGALGEAELIARVGEVMAGLVARYAPDLAVIACNTASTLVLPPLRAAFPGLPFVGTVPAVKPAAEASTTRIISVLGTPGTVARDYTRALVRDFAGDCEVTLVGAARLADLAERCLRGEAIADADIASEIAPCFVERGGRRTDKVVLACTHFPLIGDRLRKIAPWPVDFIDPAPAIARRVDALLGPRGGPRDPGALSLAVFTSARPPSPALQRALRQHGLTVTSPETRAAAL